jgi:toxin YoeB
LNKKLEEKTITVFHDEFREDLSYWVKIDRKIAIKILELVEAIVRNSFEGIGKPEPLRYLGSGVWSRRITQEHRLVYVIKDNEIDFVQCRYHY